MPLIDHLLAHAGTRQFIWKIWYPYLTRILRQEEVLFLNYAFETEPPLGIPLAPADQPHRASLQLYHHVAAQAELRGKKVLEISSGHGGGASYIMRQMRPASYTGLDLNATGVRFCQQRHVIPGLKFVQGDAQHLPFPDASFDVVLNVEASHCYPEFPRFLNEVARVLKSGGYFLYADFRFASAVNAWEQDLKHSPFREVHHREINTAVVRGMDLVSARSLALLNRHLPRLLHGLGRDFAGIRGSRVYEAARTGRLTYRSYCFVRA